LKLASEKPQFSFVQIGANDGVTADPIYPLLGLMKSHVVGTVLEPVSEFFGELQENYKRIPGVRLIRAAVHPTADSLTIYYPSKSARSGISKLAKGIASANPNHWEKSDFLQNSSDLTSETVEAITVNEVLRRHGVPVDVLVIDTEGMDFEILMSLDLDIFQVGVLRFEHGLRDQVMSSGDLEILVAKLNGSGYQVFVEAYDAVAIKLHVNQGAQ
jgi:FkbM family methyltransferase